MEEKKELFDLEKFKCGEMDAKERCCCICKYQLKIVGHPWVMGTMKDTVAYGCSCFLADNETILINHKHGSCEMFDPK